MAINLSDMFVPGINSIMRTIELTTYIITPLVAGQVWSLTRLYSDGIPQSTISVIMFFLQTH